MRHSGADIMDMVEKGWEVVIIYMIQTGTVTL
jgi:hypothetical protein